MESTMSAVAWTDVLAPGRVPTYPAAGRRRRHLVLVPGGRNEAQEPVSLRITRRGRLLLTGLVATAILALALAMLTPTAPSVAVSGTAAATVVVGPGQTLSEIAATHLPGGSVADGVARIRIANNLSSAQVSAGQRLVIPQT